MKVTKAVSTAGVGAAIIVGSMLAVNLASAQSNDRQSELVDRLATELNVDSSAVQGVFDSIQEERKAERDASEAERLASLVEDGTLSQEQADALKAKRDEMRGAREALKESGATRDEIRTQMKQSRTEFKTWAEEQGIDLDTIRPERGEGHRGGHGHHDDTEDVDSSEE